MEIRNITTKLNCSICCQPMKKTKEISAQKEILSKQLEADVFQKANNNSCCNTK